MKNSVADRDKKIKLPQTLQAPHAKCFTISPLHILFAVILFLCGCAATPVTYEPEKILLKRPAIGKVMTGRLGSVLYREIPHELRETIYISKPVNFGVNDNYRLDPGHFPRISGTATGKYPRYSLASSNENNSALLMTEKPGAERWLETRKRAEKLSLCLFEDGKRIGCEANADFKKTTRRTPIAEGTERVLVFAGLSGEDIIFSYRELSPQLSMVLREERKAVNARQTRLFSFHGLQLELLEVQPVYLRYRINAGFK